MIKRQFLNQLGHHSVGAVYAQVDDADVEFLISDCGKQISLDFNAYGPSARKNALYKADTLIAVLTEFRAALAEKFEEDKRRKRGSRFD